MQKVSKGFYLGSIIGGLLLSNILSIVGLNTAKVGPYGQPEPNAATMFGGLLLSIYAVVFMAILLYKMWKAIQPASTTPGKAVGFMFIPFFNFYWVFRAKLGWARDYNAFRQQRGVAGPAASEGVAMALCIVMLGSMITAFIPPLNMIVPFIYLILMAIFYNSGVDAINAIADAGAGQVGMAGAAAAPFPGQTTAAAPFPGPPPAAPPPPGQDQFNPPPPPPGQ